VPAKPASHLSEFSCHLYSSGDGGVRSMERFEDRLFLKGKRLSEHWLRGDVKVFLPFAQGERPHRPTRPEDRYGYAVIQVAGSRGQKADEGFFDFDMAHTNHGRVYRSHWYDLNVSIVVSRLAEVPQKVVPAEIRFNFGENSIRELAAKKPLKRLTFFRAFEQYSAEFGLASSKREIDVPSVDASVALRHKDGHMLKAGAQVVDRVADMPGGFEGDFSGELNLSGLFAELMVYLSDDSAYVGIHKPAEARFCFRDILVGPA
jgi:hypothetical protein